MKELLIVANTPSLNTRKLAQSVLNGAKNSAVSGVHVTCLEPQDASAEHVLSCDGIIIGTTENFGYMSGLVKDFFERIYYPSLEIKQGLPYSLYIRAGLDGTGAKNSIEKIINGLKWREAIPCKTFHGDFQSSFLDECNELGMHMAVGMEAGVF